MIHPFLDNVSTKRYFRLIDKYRTNSLDLYCEKHHVIPKSLGGSNGVENIVRIPARVHFILHKLLIRMLEGPELRKMKFAFAMMSHDTKNDRNTHFKVKSRDYQLTSQIKSELMKVENPMNEPKNKLIFSGANNPMKRPEILAKFIGKKRPEQAEVMRHINAQRWVREDRDYICSVCNLQKTISETIRTKRKEKWICSRTCSAKNAANSSHRNRPKSALTVSSKKKTNLNEMELLKLNQEKGIRLNKYCTTEQRAANGRKGAAKLSKLVTGRKRLYRDDGTWTWQYPPVES